MPPKSADIRVQLLPHERALIQKWNGTPEVQDQLEALAPDVDVATIKLTRVDLDWLIGDLNHAIALMSKHPALKVGNAFEIRPAHEEMNRLVAERCAAIAKEA